MIKIWKLRNNLLLDVKHPKGFTFNFSDEIDRKTMKNLYKSKRFWEPLQIEEIFCRQRSGGLAITSPAQTAKGLGSQWCEMDQRFYFCFFLIWVKDLETNGRIVFCSNLSGQTGCNSLICWQKEQRPAKGTTTERTMYRTWLKKVFFLVKWKTAMKTAMKLYIIHVSTTCIKVNAYYTCFLGTPRALGFSWALSAEHPQAKKRTRAVFCVKADTLDPSQYQAADGKDRSFMIF